MQVADAIESSYVLVLLSGGIDSSACVHFYKSMGFHVDGIFIDFGQKAAFRESEAAKNISRASGIRLLQLHVSGLPELSGKIRGRNAALIALGLMAFPGESGIIGIGIHSGTRYEDCSPVFVESIQNIVDLYSNGCIRIGAPFLSWNKTAIWDYAQKKGMPMSLTYSCEMGTPAPCGHCPSCKDIEALNVR
jgi:7-cyano-7-deazaguanine synthase